jgi:hypothetical protein
MRCFQHHLHQVPQTPPTLLHLLLLLLLLLLGAQLKLLLHLAGQLLQQTLVCLQHLLLLLLGQHPQLRRSLHLMCWCLTL